MADSCVSRVPIFAGLTPQQHDQIASAATPTKAAAGQAIYRQGDLAAPLVVVHEGLVKLTRVSADGRERVLQVMEPGDFVGETTLLGGGRPDHSAIAATKATLCVFKPQDFTNLLATHPRISYLMLVEMNKRLAGAQDRLTQVQSQEVSGRVAGYLLELEAHRSPEGIVVELPLSKKDVASLLGTTPESFSRALASLAEDDLIVPSGPRRIMLMDVDGLASRADAM